MSPLQEAANDLLQRLKKKPTRGDVVAAIQVSVIETLEAISMEMCPWCKDNKGANHGRDHEAPAAEYREPPDGCRAGEMWAAWHRVQARLWGRA